MASKEYLAKYLSADAAEEQLGIKKKKVKKKRKKPIGGLVTAGKAKHDTVIVHDENPEWAHKLDAETVRLQPQQASFLLAIVSRFRATEALLSPGRRGRACRRRPRRAYNPEPSKRECCHPHAGEIVSRVLLTAVPRDRPRQPQKKKGSGRSAARVLEAGPT
jgi:hypothetical protein